MSTAMRSVDEYPYPAVKAPVIGARLARLQPGTPVQLTQDGHISDMVVKRFSRDGSLDYARLTVGFDMPGGYCVDVTAQAILDGYVALAAPESALSALS